MSREIGPDQEDVPTQRVYPSLRVPGPTSTRSLRRATLVIAALIGLAIVKPWGVQEAPPERPRLAAPGAPATARPRQPGSPVSAICHDSPDWRVATFGLFVGSHMREFGFVTPISAAGPSDPSIPFVVFSFSTVESLGYCAPIQSPPPDDLEVRVFRLDGAGAGSLVAVVREARTPVTSSAGLFSLLVPGASDPLASPAGPPDAAGWPPGRYVFALSGHRFGDVWFGADVRPRWAGA